MNKPRRENKEKIKSGKLLSLMVVIILMLPIIMALCREWTFFASNTDDVSIVNYLKFRYKENTSIFIDIICLSAVILLCWFIIKINKRIKTSEMFVEMATAANAPVILLNSSLQLQWTNLGAIEMLKEEDPDNIVSQLTGTDTARQKIDKCLKEKTAQRFETELKTDTSNYWLHVTLSNIKNRKGENMICATMSNISDMKEANEKIANQQRELQMQTEMLSLITAQMEVQQAGVSEQNDLLQEQSRKLESQAEELQQAFSELEKRNKQIITKTSYITDSIKYAQTIQQAMLPDQSQLNAFFDNFIIYKPKDIVSGDFYWLSMNGQYTYVVLGDCTGHGVPGAFMSTIGIRLLAEIINEQKVTRPSVILETMHYKIQSVLKQELNENNDGMDIAICRFERVQNQDYDWEMMYGSAKQPLYIVRKNSTGEAEQSESDRRGIGGETFSECFFFEDRIMRLNNGDRIYLTSDGIKDQNNIMRKRFGTSKMRKALAMTQTGKIQDQKIFLNSIILNWQGLEEQRDDISLWGFELSDKIIK